MKYFAVLAVALVAAVNVATGLQCYQCVYHSLPSEYDYLFPYKSEKNCEKDPTTVVTCDTKSSIPFGLTNGNETTPLHVPAKNAKAYQWMCMSTSGTVKGNGENFKAVARSCMMADSSLDGKCEKDTLSEGGFTIEAEVCLCAGNKCNSGVVSKSSAFVAGVLAVAAIMFK